MNGFVHLENHWLVCMATVGGGGRVTRLGGALVVTNPRIGGMSFNFIALRAAEPDRLAEVIRAGSALLAEYGRPPCLYLSPAGGGVPALAERLTELGWRMHTRQTVLERPIPGEPLPPAPADVAVTTAGPADLGLWESTLVEAYEVAPVVGAGLAAAWSALQAQPGDGCSATFYLARVAGKVAGTGLLWTRAELAGLYCGAVVPALRRRGVERATLLRRLADAAAAGCTSATLQTKSGSPVEHLSLSHLSFRRVYERELWTPGSAPL